MAETIPDNRPEPSTPEKETKRPQDLTRKETALEIRMNDAKTTWLLDHITRRWDELHRNMGPWREKMKKWERQSEGDYSDRKTQVNRNSEEGQKGLPDVFAYLNESLGLTEGFVDFFTAQARDDIFGTKPWLGATPEGRSDPALAASITKHSSWKLGHSDIEETLRDGIRIATWGGTNFVKPYWKRRTESVLKVVPAAHSIATGEAYRDASGAYITSADDFPEDGDGADVEWKDTLIEEEITVYDNVCNSNVDYNDIAFKTKAPKLCLDHTDCYVRFRMGLLDLVDEYKIPVDQAEMLKSILLGGQETTRTHRDESDDDDRSGSSYDENQANPNVELVEGYLRCDVLGEGKPVRIHVIFSPELHVLFAIDHLANVSPDGILPVFPMRIHKISNRVFGMGYFEKYEAKNNSVDRKHNAISLRAQRSAHVLTVFNRDALRDPQQADVLLDPDTPLETGEGKTMADLIEYSAAPDMSDGMRQQRDAEMQMAQMQSGITSAAQGELKGVPSSNTATGTNQIISRGAVLLKDNVETLVTDISGIAEYNVHLIYANQDKDETFMWGEGEEAELMEIKAGDVKGLRMNVKLSLVQSQNQQKLESAQAAIGTINGYLMVPEVEKTAVRKLYVQVLSSLGFRDAEDIIRQAALDPVGILALMPPEYAEAMKTMMVQAGMIPADTSVAPEGEIADKVTSAPVNS